MRRKGGLYDTLVSAAGAAGFETASGAGASLGESIAVRAAAPAARLHFEPFLAKARAVLFPRNDFGGNEYTRSGHDREAQSVGMLPRAGLEHAAVGSWLGPSSSRRARWNGGDPWGDLLLASPDGKLTTQKASATMGPKGAIWNWEHKETGEWGARIKLFYRWRYIRIIHFSASAKIALFASLCSLPLVAAWLRFPPPSALV